MKKAPIVLFILLCVSIYSCGPKISENELLKEKVIQVHDEVMPKIGALKSNQKVLNEKAAELEESEDSENLQKQISGLKAAASDCEKAYDEMFVWMRQFETDLDGMSDEEAKAYLEKELLKVEKVKKDILLAIEKSEALL